MDHPCTVYLVSISVAVIVIIASITIFGKESKVLAQKTTQNPISKQTRLMQQVLGITSRERWALESRDLIKVSKYIILNPLPTRFHDLPNRPVAEMKQLKSKCGEARVGNETCYMTRQANHMAQGVLW